MSEGSGVIQQELRAFSWLPLLLYSLSILMVLVWGGGFFMLDAMDSTKPTLAEYMLIFCPLVITLILAHISLFLVTKNKINPALISGILAAVILPFAFVVMF